MLLYELHRGDSPLVVDIPHAGTHVPDAIATRLSSEARGVPDTDWHVDRLYAFARDSGATVLAATHSRYVVDLNRDPSGAALYPGAENTEICPTRTFDGEPVYRDGEAPTTGEIDARTSTFFWPYHRVLADEIERVRSRHGFAIVLDGHSIRSHVPRFFDGRLPDLNLGTADGRSADAALQALAWQAIDGRGFTAVANGRFKGGWITRHYGRPREGVHVVQLEMAQSCYMDESPPWRWNEERAARLSPVLQRLVVTMSEWRPGTTR